MSEYIEREKAIDYLMEIIDRPNHPEWLWTDEICGSLNAIPAADVRPVPDGGIGEMSDGYHTFNALYYQRLVLFAALVKAHKDRAWKSLRHEDGELCFGGGWFIVGIDTPQGSYTYHYEDKDWNRFDCVELPVAKHWDGHTEEDVTRLLSLDVRPVVQGKWVKIRTHDGGVWKSIACSNCKYEPWFSSAEPLYNFCPNCGAKMEES